MTSMRFPSNCIVSALVAWLLNPVGTQIRFIRTSTRRWHCIWVRDGHRYEFYAPGRSKLPYWRNLVYLGRIRQIGATP
ncbi:MULTISPECIES: hypothetical protein [Comamonas]|uniref:hypothetical protein n=1 Tax=Comamonas TaxID=283 RepID=UPI000750EF1E|nr:MULTISPECIES: hypothetical protein [Comamonas]